MRTLLIIAGATAALIAIDAMALHSKYQQAVWREAQNQANSFNYDFNRMVRLMGSGG